MTEDVWQWQTLSLHKAFGEHCSHHIYEIRALECLDEGISWRIQYWVEYTIMLTIQFKVCVLLIKLARWHCLFSLCTDDRLHFVEIINLEYTTYPYYYWEQYHFSLRLPRVFAGWIDGRQITWESINQKLFTHYKIIVLIKTHSHSNYAYQKYAY